MKPNPPAEWEWSADELRRVGHRTVEMIVDHLVGLRDQPVFRPFPRPLAEAYLNGPPPETGLAIEAILDKFDNEIARYPFGNGHARFYGWVNSPPVVIGIFAEALAAAMNPSCAGGNHAAIYVERQVVGWFKRIFGFPPEAMGLFVSGGSMAALTALAVARHAKSPFDVRSRGLQSAGRRLVVYRGGEAHGCHQKAVELLGIGNQNLRTVAQDSSSRMVPAALDVAIREDVEAGAVPLAAIASAGTVNTGAIDPIDEIADICARHHVWLHVDGAYGAPAILSTQYRSQLSPLARADSVAVDPHKWMYVPVEAGLVLVRDAEAMRAAFSLVPPYLQTDGNLEGVGGLPWFSEYGFQQTRGFRALKVWMALQYHGLEGYRQAIDRDIDHARALTDALRGAPDFELFEPQSLSIVCFRYAPAADRDTPTALDALNKRLLDRLQLGGRVFLSSTTVQERFWLRACFVNPLTSDDDVAAILDAVRQAATSGP
jgi:glutamate/tyrosine decarboxylase-like PLP-dependent enzyme